MTIQNPMVKCDNFNTYQIQLRLSQPLWSGAPECLEKSCTSWDILLYILNVHSNINSTKYYQKMTKLKQTTTDRQRQIWAE